LSEARATPPDNVTISLLAQLGGYLARASVPPPGNQIFWRGLTRLHDLYLCYLLANGDVGS